MSTSTRNRIDDKLRTIAEEALAAEHGSWQTSPLLSRLREIGTELWLDTGNLDEARELWHGEFTALTTNNTLANQVVQTGVLDDVAEEAVKDITAEYPGIALPDIVLELGFIVNCHIALRLVKAFGAKVSVELHPGVSQDIERTVHYAKRYYSVCPERFIIKIPHTADGLCAVARVRALGIPVNYTLGFSARQNYLAALLAKPTYCNVFLGRLNSVVTENHLGDGKLVGEKATMSTQIALRDLRAQDRTDTRLIAASMRDAQQVVDLAGCDVYTMPPKVAKAFLGGGEDPTMLQSQLGRTFDATFNPDVDLKKLDVLWTIDDGVRQVAEELVRRDTLTLTGDDVREVDAKIGAGLFHRFTAHEVVDIRDQGKIPNLSAWEHEKDVALDDLMTQSALQSFTKDQQALDDHLKTLV